MNVPAKLTVFAFGSQMNGKVTAYGVAGGGNFQVLTSKTVQKYSTGTAYQARLNELVAKGLQRIAIFQVDSEDLNFRLRTLAMLLVFEWLERIRLGMPVEPSLAKKDVLDELIDYATKILIQCTEDPKTATMEFALLNERIAEAEKKLSTITSTARTIGQLLAGGNNE